MSNQTDATGQPVQWVVDGPLADETARELSDFLISELGCEVALSRESVNVESGTRGDPVAIAALVLSIPGAVLATLDLAKRMEFKQKLEALRQRVREWRDSRGSRVRLRAGHRIWDLTDAEVSEVMQFLAELERQAP